MKYYTGKLALIFYCSMLFIKILQSQAPAYRQFTDEDGLPSMTVYNIKQDPNGFLWMNTSKGICRFDGQEFKKYEVPGLKGQDIPYFFMDEEGVPWFYNMAGEIFFIENEKIERLYIKSPLKDMNIISFYADFNKIYVTWRNNEDCITLEYQRGNINIWKRLDNNFSFFDKPAKSLIAVKRVPRDYCFELFSVPDNKLIFEFPFTNKHFNYDNEINIASMLSQDSLFLFTSCFSGILNSKNELITRIDLGKQINEKILFLSQINSNYLFIKTFNNSIIYDYVNNIKETENQFGASINTISEDRYQRRWISTTNKGLYLSFKDKVIVYNNFNSEIDSDEISCINDDYPWIITGHNNGAVSILNRLTNSWRVIQNHGLRRIKTILRNTSNSYLLGSDNGLYQLSVTNDLKNQNKFLKFGSVKDLLYLDSSRYLILTSKGTLICSYNDLRNSEYNLPDMQLLINIRSTTATKFDDMLVVGTVKGMYIQKGKNFISWNPMSDKELYINKVYNQNDSILWICTDGNGVYAYSDGKIIDSIDISNGLPSRSATCIAAFNHNTIIIGTDNGAYIYDFKKRYGFCFNQLDGLPGKEILDITYSNDTVWFGTTKGLVAVPTNKLQPNPEEPFISITSIIAFSKGGEIEFSSNLPYHSNHLRFTLQTRSLISSDQIKILYKLNNTDSSWISTKNKTLEFVGLAPGKYDLQIKAINEDGISSEKPVLLSFIINPPWWKTIWFNTLLIGTIIIGSIGITYWRQARRRLEEEKKRAIIDQMNELKQQALQNQMNPHFIFNSLNAIQNFLLVNDHENAVSYLSNFGKLIRIIFEHSKLKLISLEDEIALLRHYIYLEELRFGTKVKVTFNIDSTLEFFASEITIPPLLIQPIIENAFRHGLFHLEKNGILDIEMKKEHDTIICIIEDNGVGRKKSKQINEWKKYSYHKSSGIKSTLERIEILDQGKNKMKLEIIDLFDKAGKSSGTKVVLKL